jgi:hypothetical protein
MNMPSPFIGMDPYLEDPALFPDVHERIVYWLSDVLNSVLPPPYYTGMASRTWIETSSRRLGPDVDVLHPSRGGNGQGKTDGGIAVAQAVTRPVVVHVPRDLIRESFVEVYAQPGGERVVTNIELLNLTNKSPGEQARDLYKKKQREVLDSKVNLVEIDLLRGGKHTTAVPLDLALARTGPFDYHVCVHRFDNLEDYFVYPIKLEERLPVIEVPLLPEDSPVSVDLQAILNLCYDRGQYVRRLRYAEREPVPPLTPEQKTWVEKTLAGMHGKL